MGRVHSCVIAAAVAASACSSDPMLLADASVRDAEASPDAAEPNAVEPPIAPAPAALPAAPAPAASPEAVSFLPCPAGWTVETSTRAFGETVCLPYAGDRIECMAPDEAHWPGAAACSRIGSDCPLGQWPSVMGAVVVYVDPAAAMGGDGSSAMPFASIADAIGAAPAGAVIALSRGTFAEDVVVPSGLAIAGACVSETTIQAVRVAGSGVVLGGFRADSMTIDGASSVTIDGVAIAGVLELRGASSAQVTGAVVHGAVSVADRSSLIASRVLIAGALRRGLEIDATSSAELSDAVIADTVVDPASLELGWGISLEGSLIATRVLLEDNRELGLWMQGAAAIAMLEFVVIADTESSLANGEYGRAIEVTDGARVTGAHVLIERAHEVAVYASDVGSSIDLTQVAVRDTLPRASTGSFGRGLLANDGAVVTFDHAVIDGAFEYGAAVLDPMTTLIARDLVVRDVDGIGVTLQDGASLVLERGAFEQITRLGATITLGSTASVEDVVVRRVRGTAAGILGAGLLVSSGSQATVSRAVLEDDHLAGALVMGSGTIARFEDVVVRGIESQNGDGRFGRGLDVELGADVTIARAVIDACRDVGLFVSGSTTAVHVADVEIRGIVPNAAGGVLARGVLVQEGATLDGERIMLADNESVALAALGTATVAVSDVIVRDTESDRAGQFGIAIAALAVDGRAPVVEVTRAVLERNRHLALFADGRPGVLRARDVVVRDTRPQVLRDAFGAGAFAARGGALVLERAVLERNHFTGIGVTGAGSVAELTDVVVSDTEVDGNGIYGSGLGVEKDARARLRRVVVERNRQFGVLAQSGGDIEMVDVAVRETASLACGGDAECEAISAGVGVGAWGARVVVERFQIARNAIAGAAMAAGGTIDLRDGEILGHPIGVNVETDGFDVGRISEGVVYRDNGLNLDARVLPVPNPFAELPGVER